jgi:hypothetical protein
VRHILIVFGLLMWPSTTHATSKEHVAQLIATLLTAPPLERLRTLNFARDYVDGEEVVNLSAQILHEKKLYMVSYEHKGARKGLTISVGPYAEDELNRTNLAITLIADEEADGIVDTAYNVQYVSVTGKLGPTLEEALTNSFSNGFCAPLMRDCNPRHGVEHQAQWQKMYEETVLLVTRILTRPEYLGEPKNTSGSGRRLLFYLTNRRMS